MSNNTKWTDEETDILKKHWDKYVHYQNRNSKIAEFLPNRGSVNVYLKAKKLGLSFESTLINTECSVCHKKIKRTKTENDKYDNHFCSYTCHGKWIKKYNSSTNSPTFIRLYIPCDNCSKMFYREKHLFDMAKHNFCSMECYGIWQSSNRMGPNSATWIDGRSYSTHPYPARFNKKLKLDIKTRDNFICQRCGKYIPFFISKKESLHVHHIDYIKSNSYESNLITLCSHCHGKTSVNREYWTKYFKDFLYSKLSWCKILKLESVYK